MYTLGNATVEGLRRLLEALGALPQAGGVEAAAGTPGGTPGRRHVVITDLREELVLYVNGTAYMRRELEMPAAALHHAGAWSGGGAAGVLCAPAGGRCSHSFPATSTDKPLPSTRCPDLQPPAGIQAVKLEDLERRLRGDMLAEASRWGGKILLHREVLAAQHRGEPPRVLQGAAGGACVAREQGGVWLLLDWL